MSALKDQVGRIASDLMNLEINTIIKPNVTSRKMPSPAHALIDIAKKFTRKLAVLGYPIPTQGFSPGSFTSFDVIREKAKCGIITLEEKSQHAGLSEKEECDLTMLWRIKTMSDQIKGIFNTMADQTGPSCKNDFSREDIENKGFRIELNAEELVKIRKIWEIGTEEVALQTVIQMDGDVITRVSPMYARESYKALQLLHDKGVRTSVDFWKDIVQLVVDSLKSILKLIFTR